MKKLILSLCILALLCGCQKAKETVETTSDAVEIGNTSESYYRMINVGASQLRDDYYSKFSRTDDLMTIGRGLQILSDEYFSMDSYYMIEDIHEQDYYQKSGNQYSLSGVSFAIVLDPKSASEQESISITDNSLRNFAENCIKNFYSNISKMKSFEKIHK